MPGIEIKGRSKIANYRHGGRTGKFGGGRTNLLEQLGRVEAEPSNPNRRAEISRVHGELNRGYAKGGRAGFAHGTGRKLGKVLKKFRDIAMHEVPTGPHTDVRRHKLNPSFIKRVKRGNEIRREKLKKLAEEKGIDPSETFGGRRIQTKGGPGLIPPKRKDDVGVGGYQEPLENIKRRDIKKGGRIGFKKGTDKRWIQKAVDPKHKGYCTPMTKKTCTPARKALARTFKKKAKTGWG